MDVRTSDVEAARHRLRERGWIARGAEPFRHLRPPAEGAWLGDDGVVHLGPADAGWVIESSSADPAAVQVRRLDAADPAGRAELFAGLALPDEGDAAPFAWAHRALCRSGLRVRVGAGAGRDGRPVELHLRHTAGASVAAPLLVVELEAGARCVLRETHDRQADDPRADGPETPQRRSPGAGIVENLQVHVRLAEGATLHHLRVVLPDGADRVAHHVDVRAGRDARYEQASIAAGCAYHLQRADLALQGEASAAAVATVLCASGSDVDRQVRVSHAAAGTRSAVEQFALAGAGATVVLNAHTAIPPGADEAAAHQRLAAIPTAGRPKVVLRPHLEILHDKVQASHGATFGALPADALFYARQRGLDEARARALIVEGMAAAVLARGITDAAAFDALAIHRHLARVVERQLAAPAQETTDA